MLDEASIYEMAERISENSKMTINNMFIPTASKKCLDNLSALYGLERKTYFFGIFKESDKKLRKRTLNFVDDNHRKLKFIYQSDIWTKVKSLFS